MGPCFLPKKYQENIIGSCVIHIFVFGKNMTPVVRQSLFFPRVKFIWGVKKVFFCDRPACTTGTLRRKAGSWARSSMATSWPRSPGVTWRAAWGPSGYWVWVPWGRCCLLCSPHWLPTWAPATSSPSGSWKASGRYVVSSLRSLQKKKTRMSQLAKMFSKACCGFTYLFFFLGCYLPSHVQHVGSMGSAPGEESSSYHLPDRWDGQAHPAACQDFLVKTLHACLCVCVR